MACPMEAGITEAQSARDPAQRWRSYRGTRFPEYLLLPFSHFPMPPIDQTSQKAVAKAAWEKQKRAGGESETKQASDWPQWPPGKTPKKLVTMVTSGVGGGWRIGGQGKWG